MLWGQCQFGNTLWLWEKGLDYSLTSRTSLTLHGDFLPSNKRVSHPSSICQCSQEKPGWTGNSSSVWQNIPPCPMAQMYSMPQSHLVGEVHLCYWSHNYHDNNSNDSNHISNDNINITFNNNNDNHHLLNKCWALR